MKRRAIGGAELHERKAAQDPDREIPHMPMPQAHPSILEELVDGAVVDVTIGIEVRIADRHLCPVAKEGAIGQVG